MQTKHHLSIHALVSRFIYSEIMGCFNSYTKMSLLRKVIWYSSGVDLGIDELDTRIEDFLAHSGVFC